MKEYLRFKPGFSGAIAAPLKCILPTDRRENGVVFAIGRRHASLAPSEFHKQAGGQ